MFYFRKILIDASEPNLPKYTEYLSTALKNSEISCILATLVSLFN